MGLFATGKVKAAVIALSVIFAVLAAAPAAMALASGVVGSWSTSSNHLPLDICGAASVEYNGYTYVLGGTSSSSGNLSSVYYAKLNSDGSVGSWSTSSNSLPQVLYYPSAAVANGYIYVMGGYNAGYQNTVYYAKINSDGSIGAWTTSSNHLPQGINQAAAQTHNGYLYFMGGVNSGSTALNTVYYAKTNSDGSIGSWTTSTNNLPQATYDAASVVNNGYAYILGGVTPSVTSAAVYSAAFNSDGSIGAWTTSSNSLPQAVYGPVGATTDGYVYVAGGNNTSNQSQSTVYYANLASNGSVGSWSTSTNSLPQPLQYSTAVAYDGYLHIFGGQNNGQTQTTVYGANLNFVSQESITDTATSAPVAITTPTGTNITSSSSSAATTSNSGYTYPLGLVSFTFSTDTATNQVSLVFQTTLQPNQVVAQKYNSNTRTYSTIPGAVITETTLNGQPALNVSYAIADGGPLDEDGAVNGVIVDPVTLAEATSSSSAVAAPNTGYGTPASNTTAEFAAVAGVLLCMGMGLLMRNRHTVKADRT